MSRVGGGSLGGTHRERGRKKREANGDKERTREEKGGEKRPVGVGGRGGHLTPSVEVCCPFDGGNELTPAERIRPDRTDPRPAVETDGEGLDCRREDFDSRLTSTVHLPRDDTLVLHPHPDPPSSRFLPPTVHPYTVRTGTGYVTGRSSTRSPSISDTPWTSMADSTDPRTFVTVHPVVVRPPPGSV